MTDKEFHKLGRRELLQLLLAQAKEADELREQLTETSEQLRQLEENYERLRKRLDHKDEQIHKLRDSLQAEKKKREIELADAGSIAEASLRLNGIFEAAQKAADQYLHNIRLLQGDQMTEYPEPGGVTDRIMNLADERIQVRAGVPVRQTGDAGRPQESAGIRTDVPGTATVRRPSPLSTDTEPEMMNPRSGRIAEEAASAAAAAAPAEPAASAPLTPAKATAPAASAPLTPEDLALEELMRTKAAEEAELEELMRTKAAAPAELAPERKPLQTPEAESVIEAEVVEETGGEPRAVEVVEVELVPQERTGRPYWPEVEEEPTIPEWADNVSKPKVPLPRDKVRLSRGLPAGHQARIRNFRLR